MISSVAVIGTIFIDCKGFAKQTYHPFGRNLGEIQFFHGGVGRNVAENLANMKVNTRFISTVDHSGLGQEVRSRLRTAGVGLEYLIPADDHGMGMWMAVLDNKGDLAGSISQMPDLKLLEDLIVTKGREIVNASTHIVLELDLNSHITRHVLALAKKNHTPVFGIPGNLAVILGNKDILADLACFICNDIEAGRLLGMDFAALDIKRMQQTLKDFVNANKMRSMVITLGSKGAVYYDADKQEEGYQPVFHVDVVDSSGAGDAFFSGTVMALTKKSSLKQAVVYGTRVAAWTIECSENNCKDLWTKLEAAAM